MNVPFVIDSTLTTDDSSLAGTVGMVIVYRKEQEDRQKVKAQVYSLDGDTLNVAVGAVAAIGHAAKLLLVCAVYERREHEPGPRWLRMPTTSGVPAARAGLL